MPLSPNTQLGSYQILGPLGAGGMGEVYRARDTQLGRDVALKVLPKDVAKDRDRLARFTREAQLLASLNQAIPDSTDERNRKIFPQTIRVILNWNAEVRRLLDAEH